MKVCGYNVMKCEKEVLLSQGTVLWTFYSAQETSTSLGKYDFAQNDDAKSYFTYFKGSNETTSLWKTRYQLLNSSIMNVLAPNLHIYVGRNGFKSFNHRKS